MSAGARLDPPLAKLLRRAPELASLLVLDDALCVIRIAFLAEHPTLDELDDARDPPSLRHARRFVAASITLRRALARYRRAVYAAIRAEGAPSDDLPF